MYASSVSVSKSIDAITEKSVMQFPGIHTDEPSDQQSQESSDVKKSQNNKTNDVAYIATIRNDSSSTYDFEHGNPTDNQMDSNFSEIGPSVSDYNNVSDIKKKRLISFIH